MRNTPETDYVINCNHVSADGHFDSLVMRVFCPGQTTPSSYLREKNVWVICITVTPQYNAPRYKANRL